MLCCASLTRRARLLCWHRRALELLLPVPQFTGAVTRIANGPAAAIASVTLITAIAAAGVPLDALAGLGGSTGGALLIYIAPALMALKLREASMAPADAAGSSATPAAAPIDATTIGLLGVIGVGAACAAIGTVDSLGAAIGSLGF